MSIYDTKTSIQSATFWGAIVGGVMGVIQVIGGIKKGDSSQINEGILAVVGFFTAWRLRKGQQHPIQDE